MKPRLKWIPKFKLWDCCLGEIHGGGKTPKEAYDDLQWALYCEWTDW